MRKQSIGFLTVLLLSVAVTAAQAASREKVFTGFAGNQVFQSAVKAARENFMLTYVDEKNMTFVFHTDTSLTYGFDWKASVMKTRDGVKLILNVPSQPQMLASGLGERIAERLFEATVHNLATEGIVDCRLLRPAAGNGAVLSSNG